MSALEQPEFRIYIDGELHTETNDPAEFESTRSIIEEKGDIDYQVDVPEWFGDDEVEAEIIEHTDGGTDSQQNGHEEPPETTEAVDVVDDTPIQESPQSCPTSEADMLQQAVVDWFGGKDSPFISEIDHGRSTSLDLNKDGTQLVRSILDLEMDRECEVHAEETEFEYCRYRATVTRPDGKSFTAIGDAHIDEGGKDKWDLERLAETRAKKRAVKWATAGGVEALLQAGESDE